MSEVPWLGRLIASRYRLIARLGEGKMAEVYLARHVLIDRLSAIKVLRREWGGDRTLRRAFLREAKAVNRINHPNIVEISDYGETEETAYLVMEYVPGESLSRHLARAPLGWERACKMARQVGLALTRAHEMGVIHRDIQPRNVLLVPGRGGDDVVKLTDFGVAKLLDPNVEPRPTTGGFVTERLTPEYMAPEMRRGAVDARGDIFSLGVLVYEATCGELPFPPGTLAEHSSGPVSLRQKSPEVPADFAQLVTQLLSISPEDRPRDAFEVVAMLSQLLDHTGVEGEADPPTERIPRPAPAPSFATLRTIPFDRIGPLSRSFHQQVRSAEANQPGVLSASELATLEELVEMIDKLHLMVTEDARKLAALEERGRVLRKELGARLDELGLERSRALGWASTAAERSDHVRAKRLSGVLSIGTMDALLWEEATLEHEEDRSIQRAAELEQEIQDLSRKLEFENDELERDQSSMEAQFEGHVAALRALAGEAWQSLQASAHKLRVALQMSQS